MCQGRTCDSTLTNATRVLRRLKDSGAVRTAVFRAEYGAELERVLTALEGRSSMCEISVADREKLSVLTIGL